MKIKWWGWYVIVVTTILLFWVSSRENELKRVRSICHVRAMKDAQNQFMQRKALAPAWQRAEMPDGNFYMPDYEQYYRQCLRSYGIEDKNSN